MKKIILIISIIILLLGWGLISQNKYEKKQENKVNQEDNNTSDDRNDIVEDTSRNKQEDKSDIDIYERKNNKKYINNKEYQIKRYKEIKSNTIRVDESNFIIENKIIVGIKDKGIQAIKKTKAISIPEGIVGIKDGVFKNLNLEKVYFPSTLKEIGKDSFYGNNLHDLDFPVSLIKIERGAFDNNNLQQVVLKNPNCQLDGIFYNKQYVNIITANKDIKDQTYLNTTISYNNPQLDKDNIKPYGSLVNRSGVDISYFDENNKLEFHDKLVSKQRKSRYKRISDDLNKYYKIGDKINVVARRNDYLHLGRKIITAGIKNEVSFYYRNKAKIEEIQKEDKSPIINGLNKPLLIIIGSINSKNPDYKDGVFASDYKLNNITDSLRVLDANKVDLKKPGTYVLNYEVTDNEGNKTIGQREVYVEEEKKWYNHDFYFDGDILLGLSEVGEYKLNEILVNPNDKVIELPKYNDKGEIVTKVGSAAFARLRIRNVLIPDTYQEIRSFAFESTLLKNLKLPTSIIEIQERAFAFTDIENLELPQELKKIKERAFASTELKEIRLPQSLEELGEGAFMNNSKLKHRELEIPSKIKVIAPNTFENCRLLKIVLNEGLEEIGDNAFGKNDLTEVKYLPNSLKKLAPAAFKQNGVSTSGSRFKPVKLYTKDGKNPYNFQTNTFQEINPVNKEEEIVDYDEDDFIINNGVIEFSDKGKNKAKNNKNLVIPDLINNQKVTEIKTIAFMSKQLKTIKLPKHLEKIGDSAFYLNNLEKVVIPDSVKVIEGSAFYDNNNLKEVVLSKSLEVIGKNAFLNTNLTKVYLPKTIKKIEDNAFKLKQSSRKVILVIEYSEETKEFIKTHKNRRDFKLEVLGQIEEKEEISLKNKPTKYGIKLGEILRFNLENIKEKPQVMVNKQVVPSSVVDNVLYISSYQSKITNQENQVFTFIVGKKTFEIKIKFFIPDTIKLEDETKEYEYQDGLVLKLKNSKYELEDLKLYRSLYTINPESKISFKANELKIPKELVESLKKQNILELYVEGKYHEKSKLVIKLKETKKEEGLEFNLLSNNDDTYIYESNELDDELYEKIKEEYNDNKIEITIGRSKFEKDEYGDKDSLSDETYIMEFNDENHKITFAINKPQQWETLNIQFNDKEFKFSIDDDYKLVKEE